MRHWNKIILSLYENILWIHKKLKISKKNHETTLALIQLCNIFLLSITNWKEQQKSKTILSRRNVSSTIASPESKSQTNKRTRKPSYTSTSNSIENPQSFNTTSYFIRQYKWTISNLIHTPNRIQLNIPNPEDNHHKDDVPTKIQQLQQNQD